jgi:hypothetical protein
MAEDVIYLLKQLIDDNSDVKVIEGVIEDLPYDSLPMDYIIQKVYIHACLKKRRGIAEWILAEAEKRLDPIQWMAIRQMGSYGRHLLTK